MTATILLAHGSRDPLWRLSVDLVRTRMVLMMPDHLVRCAFLEFCSPDLGTALSEMVALGATSITVMPMFMGMGRHVRLELPRLAGQLKRQFSEIDLIFKPPIGESPEMIDLLARMALS